MINSHGWFHFVLFLCVYMCSVICIYEPAALLSSYLSRIYIAYISVSADLIFCTLIYSFAFQQYNCPWRWSVQWLTRSTPAAHHADGICLVSVIGTNSNQTLNLLNDKGLLLASKHQFCTRPGILKCLSCKGLFIMPVPILWAHHFCDYGWDGANRHRAIGNHKSNVRS